MPPKVGGDWGARAYAAGLQEALSGVEHAQNSTPKNPAPPGDRAERKRPEMTGPENLTPRQQRGIVALLTQPTIADAARATGIGEKTLRRWLALPEFQVSYHQERQHMFRDAVGRLTQIARRAVDTLDQHLDAERPADAIRAAVAILDHARQAIELDDLAGRISALEQRQQLTESK